MKVKKLTVSISGFGGGYEDMCQRMLWRGVAYLNEVNPPIEMWQKATSYENVYGILNTEGDDLKGLEDAIIFKGEDVTGAMHQATMSHIAYVHTHGVEKWLDEFRNSDDKEMQDRVFEWEGSLDPTV